MKYQVTAFEERPFPVGPEPDGGFNRTGQLVEVGIPQQNFEVREALLVRPYYLGEEIKFYEQPTARKSLVIDRVKYPMLSKILSKHF